jgi:YNFM family putative membrane transporter
VTAATVAPAGAVPVGHPGHRPGTPAYRRSLFALFCAGVATFAALYVVQPLLPTLGRAFDRSPAQASLSLSVSTLTLALAILPVSRLSERYGRGRVLAVSLLFTGLFGLVVAASTSWPELLLLRAVQGVALAGIPAVALAWVAEEMHPDAVSRAGGLYVAGTTIGGMSGRLVGGGLAELGGWRTALLGIGVLSLVCAAACVRLLPASRSALSGGAAAARTVAPVSVRLRLYLIGGLAMAAFVGVYNVLGYRLEAAPYALRPGVAGLVFLAYLAGTWSSARGGRLAGDRGMRFAIGVGVAAALAGVALTLARPLPLVIAGVALMTAGFFAMHAVASSNVARLAPRPSAAAGRYLLCYYLGSSLGGPLLGQAWTSGGWSATAAVAAALFAAAGVAAAVRYRGQGVPVSRPAAARG